MTETEFLCQSFIDTAIGDKKDGDIIYFTVVNNNGSEIDVIPQVNEKMSTLISSYLNNKTKVKKIKEIQIKVNNHDNIKIINKIEIK